ncbi:uncharacterized protein [Clytia hemisphaerica]
MTASFYITLLLFSLLGGIHSAITPCPENWTLLSRSNLCVRLQNATYFDHSIGLCSIDEIHLQGSETRVWPLLLGFQDVETDDFSLLDITLGSNVKRLWTVLANGTCSKRNKTHSSWETSLEMSCDDTSELIHSVCILPSRITPIDTSEFRDYHFSASSFYTENKTFGLLKYEPQNIALNKTFRIGLFEGAGWCSNTDFENEFWQIDFPGQVWMSGLYIQNGIVKNCSLWISKFLLNYHNGEGWLSAYVNDTNQSADFQNEHGSFRYWFDYPIEVEKLRLEPLEYESNCLDSNDTEFDRFCMRIQFYGYYIRKDFGLRVIKGHDLSQKHVGSLDETSETSPIPWPSGSYALLKTNQKCPRTTQGVVLTGSLIWKSIGTGNSSSAFVKQDVCIHKNNNNSTTDNISFPSADYCIYGIYSCPDGFTENQLNRDVALVEEHQNPTFVQEGDNFTTSQTVLLCCRQDAVNLTFPFVIPFALIPNNTTDCSPFDNSTYASVLVEPDEDPSLRYCIHYPTNDVDELVLSTLNKIQIKNPLFPTIVQVRSKSGGNFINSGLDADKVLAVQLLNSSSCHASVTNLTNGTGSITLSNCNLGSTIVTVSIETERNVTVQSQMELTFTNDFNVLVMAEQTQVVDKLDIHSKTGSIRTQSFATDGQFYLHTNQSHLMFFIETTEEQILFEQHLHRNKEQQKLVFDIEHRFVHQGFEDSMFVSLPPDSNFYAILLEEKVQTSGRVVLLRTDFSASYSDLYAIYRANLQLYKDIIVDAQGKNLETQLQGIPRNITIIMFLDSIRASYVLPEATRQGLTPANKYHWISVSPQFTISNTFMRGPCLYHDPPCHITFDSMWNIFHYDDLDECDKLPSAYMPICTPITDFRNMIYTNLVPTVFNEVKLILDYMLVELNDTNKTLTTEFFVNFTQNIVCFPHGSGLRFVFRETYNTENTTIYDFMCQPGWSGTYCNEPFCTRESCNETHGSCIAPQVCKCQPGRFGRDCNGDCKKTCVHGVCNEGMFGDGACKSCEWLYLGKYCNEYTIIYGFIAAGIGTTVCGVFLMLYIVRLIQTQEQNAVAEIEASEKDYTMKWNDLETFEEVDYTSKVVGKQINHKLLYTTYKKGLTFTGQQVFIKCIEKPHFQITLGVKNEIQQLCQLSHNNIEQLLGIIVSQSRVGVVTPNANMGSLYDVLHAKNIWLTWDVRYSMMQDICRGMTYLHDIAKIKHGRLKSTNCLVYKGWQTKVGDIGLKMVKARKREKRFEAKRDSFKLKSMDDSEKDYRSLLWTAPELTCSGATNLDQVIRFTNKADVYSFGIILSEIISRRPPYSEISVMSIEHIVQAVAHLREPIVSLDQMNPGQETTGKDVLKTAVHGTLLRPKVDSSFFPADESESSILKMLMESCWSESEVERPPFAYALEVLELITPLKGSPLLKRAILLERETESLEKYICHDTNQIFKEQDKIADLLARMLPPFLATKFLSGDPMTPTQHNNVTVLIVCVHDLDRMVTLSSPTQLVDIISYLWKTVHVIIKKCKLKINYIKNRGDTLLFGAGFDSNSNRHAYDVTMLATQLLKTARSLEITNCPAHSVTLQAGIYTGPCTSAVITTSGTANHTLIGEAIDTARILERDALPNCVHASKKTTHYLSNNEFDIVSRTTYRLRVEKQILRTFWVGAK